MSLRFFFIAAGLLLFGIFSARAEGTYSFGQGARGFLIRDYNERLLAFLRTSAPEHVREPRAMDEFGPETAENTRQLQAGIPGSHGAPGRAGPAEFAAVGLASVYLAAVANELALSVPLLLGVFVAALLHLLNLALAAFSPMVQALRLHYVEFFSGFYEGGGIAFRPFGRRPQSALD